MSDYLLDPVCARILPAIRASEPWPASVRELVDVSARTSTNTVMLHLRHLEAAGLVLRRDGQPGTLLTDAGRRELGVMREGASIG